MIINVIECPLAYKTNNLTVFWLNRIN